MLPKTFIVWLAATYACVVVAVAIDFVSAVAGLLRRLLQEFDSEDEAERKEDGHAKH